MAFVPGGFNLRDKRQYIIAFSFGIVSKPLLLEVNYVLERLERMQIGACLTYVPVFELFLPGSTSAPLPLFPFMVHQLPI